MLKSFKLYQKKNFDNKRVNKLNFLGKKIPFYKESLVSNTRFNMLPSNRRSLYFSTNSDSNKHDNDARNRTIQDYFNQVNFLINVFSKFGEQPFNAVANFMTMISFFMLILGYMKLEGIKAKIMDKLNDTKPINNEEVILDRYLKIKNIRRRADEEFEKIVNQNYDTIPIFLIHGPEDSGREQLVINYYKEKYLKSIGKNIKTVIFLQANMPNLEYQYRQFAKKIGIVHEVLELSELKTKFDKELAHRGEWLIIILNVKEFSGIEKYIPSYNQFSKGSVILTSEKIINSTNKNFKITPIDIMDEKFKLTKQEAITIFDTTIGKNHKMYDLNKNKKGDLAEKLLFLPGAIEKAAAYINIQNITIDEYFSRFDKELSLGNYSYEEVNKITYKLSFEKLSQQAKIILEFCSFVDSNQIEKQLISTFFAELSTKISTILEEIERYYLINEVEENVFELSDALANLIKLIKFNEKKKNYKDFEDFKHIRMKEFMVKFKTFLSPDNRNKENAKTYRLLAHHAQVLIDNIDINSAIKKNDDSLVRIYMHIIDSISNYYSSSANDYLKARDNLSKIVDLSDFESILNIYSGHDNKIDITKLKQDKLNDNIIFLYSRILYSYGRLYFYIRDEKYLSKKKAIESIKKAISYIDYYEKHIDFKIFEKVLYHTNGLLYFLIESDNTEDVNEAIKLYKQYLTDENPYKGREGNDIMIKDESGKYTRMVCNDQIAKSYYKLMAINQSSANFLTFLRQKNYWNKYCDYAIVHSVGGKYIDINEVEENYEGAIQLCKSSKFKTREPIYLNTLANVLLMNPNDYKLQFVKTISLDIKLDNTVNNIDLAEKIFLESKNKCGNSNELASTLADVQYGLAKIYYQKGLMNEAYKEILNCISTQKYIKRSDKHPEFFAAIQLLGNINKKQLSNEASEIVFQKLNATI